MTALAKGRFLRIGGMVILLAALLAGLMLAAGGPGYRLGLWDYGFALISLTRAAFLTAAGAGSLALLALLFLLATKRMSLMRPFLLALILSGATLGIVQVFRSHAGSIVPIHDVTTDLEDPPVFVVIPPREYNPLIVPDRGRADLAQLMPRDRWRVWHREAYGDIVPIETGRDKAAAFEAALAAARRMGWEIVDADAERGTIEATATTFWYGFKDDVAIRVREEPSGGSRIDIRSVSRVGISDLGANAARIRAWRDHLLQELGAAG
ncbi:MAG: hypothetical protein Tsb008_18900 [Rhodothalassiaceae bacterium]